MSSLAKLGADWSPDTISTVVRMAPGWLAIGTAWMGTDDAALVAWKSADLVHWSRVAPAVGGGPTCNRSTVHEVNQGALVGGKLVAVGGAWNMDTYCSETWIARVTP